MVIFGVLAVGVAAGLVAGLTADTPPNTAESDFLTSNQRTTANALASQRRRTVV